jgi:CDP-paratose 2-epimerase
MKVLVTGCCGLVGSALVDHFCRGGHEIVGLDNGARRVFFGPDGSTAKTGFMLVEKYSPLFRLFGQDICHRETLFEAFLDERPDAVIHCAAQPSHDWAAEHPLADFNINAGGTLNVIEAARLHCPDAPFVFMSTNKIYGADLNKEPLVESDIRFEFESAENGVNEQWEIDQTMHALYGAGKLAADIYVQEYGRYYDMRTVCLRAGCITGVGHAAVSLHGFLSYLVKCNLSGEHYMVKGYGGKQVRDNLHAADLAELIGMMIERPPEPGSVYNVGGGKANSCSILEAFAAIEGLTGKPMNYSHDSVPRRGDHACYYTDLRKVTRDYGWRPRRDLPAIYEDLVADWMARG